MPGSLGQYPSQCAIFLGIQLLIIVTAVWKVLSVNVVHTVVQGGSANVIFWMQISVVKI